MTASTVCGSLGDPNSNEPWWLTIMCFSSMASSSGKSGTVLILSLTISISMTR